MRIFLANWRVALKRERVWLIPLILYALSGFLAVMEDIKLLAIVTLSVVLWIGVCLAIALSRGQFAVAAKPFTYCLPGYRESQPKLHLTASVLFSGGLLLVLVITEHGDWMSFFPDTSWRFMIAKIASIVLMGMVTFFVMEALRLAFFRLPRTISVISSMVVFYAGLGVFRVAQGSHGVTVVWLVLTLALLWFCLGRTSFLKWAHRRVINTTTSTGIRLGLKGVVLPQIERLFLAQMSRNVPLGAMCYFWGGLYRTLGPVLLYWRWLLLGVVAFVLVCSYGGQEARGVIFIALGVIAWFVPLPIRSPLLLPGGRRERYAEAVFIAVAISLGFAALAGAIIGSSLLVVFLWPGSLAFAATDVQWGGVLLACLVLPWSFAFQLSGVGWRGLVAIMIGTVYVLDTGYRLIGIGKWSSQAQMMLLFTVFICGWVFFLLILRFVCTKGCLVGSSKGKGG